MPDPNVARRRRLNPALDAQESRLSAYSPSAEELRRGLDEIYYEMEQLLSLSLVTANQQALLNPILESRLLHVRTLMDFFEQAVCAKDDILASHYGFTAAALAIEPLYRERLNKDLAHLTYSRTKRAAEDKPWPHDRVVRPVLDRCHDFIQHLLTSCDTYGTQPRSAWEQLMKGLMGERAARRALGGV